MPEPSSNTDKCLRIAPPAGGANPGVRFQPSRRLSLVAWADKAVMDGTRWHRQILDGKDFQGANLRDAIFEGCSLEACDFSGADLRGARFVDCDVRRANFDHALLEGAVFCRSWLTGANGLTGAGRALVRRAGAWFLVVV